MGNVERNRLHGKRLCKWAMDVYDFDGTLYKGDSTADFFKFCLIRHPRIALMLPRIGVAALACYKFHAIDKTRFKSVLYRFLRFVPDVDREVRLFWMRREDDVCGLCDPRSGDLVVSAGPEFLLRDVCLRRGLELIASHVDPHTGNVLGPNCSNEEKVVRLHERYPSMPIERFFSDSHNDDPLATIAKQAFMVDIRKNTVEPWPNVARD